VLGAFCLIHGLFPGSVEEEDMSVLILKVWCRSPELLPVVVDLLAKEPIVFGEDGSWAPCTLAFPVSVVVIHSDGILAFSVDPPSPPPSGFIDEDSDHEHHVEQWGCPATSVQVPIYLRLGQRSRSGKVDYSLMSVQAVDQDLVEVGSVDAPALPVVSVEELDPPDLEMIMAMDLGSVDALALQEVSVAELEAPGHPPVLALDLAEDLGVSCQVDCLSQDVISPVKPCSDDPLEVVLMTNLEEVVTAGQHGVGFSYLVADGSSAIVEEVVTAGHHGSGFSQLVADGSSSIVSARVRRLGSCQSSRADRWRSKPPVFKVYSRRILSQAQVVQEDLLLQSVVEMIPPLEEFKSAVTKPSDGLLPSPPHRRTKSRKKAMLSDFRPRRSRRVAKFPPELSSNAAAQVCRHLGFCDDMENISLEDASNYAKLFDSALSSVHVAVLAALFGWEVPQVGAI
jgi:hypothetical protein